MRASEWVSLRKPYANVLQGRRPLEGACTHIRLPPECVCVCGGACAGLEIRREGVSLGARDRCSLAGRRTGVCPGTARRRCFPSVDYIIALLRACLEVDMYRWIYVDGTG